MSIAEFPDNHTQDLRLSQQHWHLLATERGIDPAIIKERGYLSALRPEDLTDRTFSKAQAKQAPALVIPRWNVHGIQDGWQMRPDQPRQFTDGRIGKYESPPRKAGELGNILDIHPRLQPLIGDPTEPLWVTEGIPKGDALASHGACTLALQGVWGFKGTNEHGGKVILPDWEFVALNDRLVYVVYDSDIYHKPDVDRALKALYRFLRHKGARPARVEWSEDYRQKKWGVDDFLAQGHTLDDLLAMVPPQGPLPASPARQVPAAPKITFDELKNGQPRPALLNILYVLEQHPAWKDALGFDELLNDVVWLRCPPYRPLQNTWTPRPVTEYDWSETANWMQRTYELYVSSGLAGEGLTTYGFRFPFHPIRTYLQSLTWDTKARLDTWLHTYCHVADSPYSRAVSSKTLIAAVARIMKPGCKVDTMTILEGEQGLGKSEAWRALISDAWFADGLPDLHDKDAAQALNGKWCIELAELSQFQRSEIETVKAFLSRPADHYRPSYGRRSATFPRQQIFVGSTNAEHYFKDRTGNRRYWPVTVEAACDTQAIARDRDQLWAEAMHRYQQDEQWHMTADLETLAREEQALRLEPDDWEVPVLTYVQDKSKVTTRAIMVEQFQWDNPALWTKANTNRIGAILRGAGWKAKPFRLDDTTSVDGEKGTLVKGYVKETVTHPIGNNSSMGNSLTTNKNNAVTHVTHVTHTIHTYKENCENAQNDVLRKNTLFTGLQEKDGNMGNMGNRPLSPAAPDCRPAPCAHRWVQVSPDVARCERCGDRHPGRLRPQERK